MKNTLSEIKDSIDDDGTVTLFKVPDNDEDCGNSVSRKDKKVLIKH